MFSFWFLYGILCIVYCDLLPTVWLTFPDVILCIPHVHAERPRHLAPRNCSCRPCMNHAVDHANFSRHVTPTPLTTCTAVPVPFLSWFCSPSRSTCRRSMSPFRPSRTTTSSCSSASRGGSTPTSAPSARRFIRDAVLFVRYLVVRNAAGCRRWCCRCCR